MNFKQISVILGLLTLNSNVLGSPIKKPETSIEEIEFNPDGINNLGFIGHLDNNSLNNKLAFTPEVVEDKNIFKRKEQDISKKMREEEKKMREEEKKKRKEEKQKAKEEKQKEKEMKKEEKQKAKEQKKTEKEEKKYAKKNELCTTSECQKIADRIIKSMDETADPCDDFYQFSCGGWMNEHEIPSGGSISVNSIGQSRNTEIIKKIFTTEYKVDENLSAKDQELDKNLYDKLKGIYDTCMDVEAINAKGNKPMLELYDKLKIYENREKFNTAEGLTEQIITMNKYGIFPFFKIGGHSDYEKAGNYLIAILQNGLTLNKDYYKYEVLLVEVRKYIKNILLNLFDSTKRDLDVMTESILNFELKLANIYVASVNLQNPSYFYNKRTINDLNELYPSIKWDVFFKKRLEFHGIDYEITDETIFIDMTPDYFAGLNKLLAETDVDTIAYYLEWRVIDRFYEYLSSDLQGPVKELSQFMFGASSEGNLVDKCVEMADDMMDTALSRYFIETAYNNNVKTAAEEIFRNIKEAVINRVPQIDWLDKETSDYALQKLKNIAEKIAYPDIIMDLDYLTKKYEPLEIKRDDYFNNYISYINMYQKNDLSRIVSPNSAEWRYAPQMFNAFYNPTENSINLLAGILQPPFYDANQPDYINYGAIGMAVGHETNHAFDNTGRQYDMNGSYKNWWTEKDNQIYKENAQCYVNQYGNYTIEGKDGTKHNVDGSFTLNENIADNAGVARAYEAWKISVNKDATKAKENNKLLPGLTKYTKDQLFFIAFGQSMCTKMTPELAVSRLSADNHAPSAWRVRGVLSNLNSFAEAFNCPVNSPMNPESKCELW